MIITFIVICVIIGWVILQVLSSNIKTQEKQKRRLQKSSEMVLKMVNRNAQILQESLQIIENTDKLDTARSRIKLLNDFTVPGLFKNAEKYKVNYNFSLVDLSECVNRLKQVSESDLFSGIVPVEWADNHILCPKCNYRFEEEPTRKRKCPKCKTDLVIYKFNNEKCLITNDQYIVIKEKEINMLNEFKTIIKDFKTKLKGGLDDTQN